MNKGYTRDIHAEKIVPPPSIFFSEYVHSSMHIVLLRSLLFSEVACFMFTFCVCVTVQWNVNKLVFCFLFLLIYYSITKHQKHLFSRWLLKTIEICKLTILWQIWFMIYLAHVAGYGGEAFQAFLREPLGGGAFMGVSYYLYFI